MQWELLVVVFCIGHSMGVASLAIWIALRTRNDPAPQWVQCAECGEWVEASHKCSRIAKNCELRV